MRQVWGYSSVYSSVSYSPKNPGLNHFVSIETRSQLKATRETEALYLRNLLLISILIKSLLILNSKQLALNSTLSLAQPYDDWIPLTVQISSSIQTLP